MKSLLCICYLFCANATAICEILHVSQQPLPSISPDRQFRTIQDAAKIAVAADRVIIHSGIYRESVVIEKSGTREKPITFEAAPNANVVVTGLDRLTDWRKESGGENIFSASWPHQFLASSKTGAFPDDEYHRLIGR